LYAFGRNKGNVLLTSGCEKVEVPTRIELPFEDTPVNVQCGSFFVSVKLADGKVWRWGEDNKPEEIMVESDHTIRSLHAGGNFIVCLVE
jgi:alpha-tubulin suppressor-like RCC1 family protein